MDVEFSGFAPQGWQCPICKRIYSPTTPMCWYCGNETVTVATGTEIKPGYTPPVEDWGNTKTVPKFNKGQWEIDHTNWDNEMRNG